MSMAQTRLTASIPNSLSFGRPPSSDEIRDRVKTTGLLHGLHDAWDNQQLIQRFQTPNLWEGDVVMFTTVTK